MSELYSIPVQRFDGSNESLASYQGHVLLIVNVASHCGLTAQYEGLQKLYDTYRDRGLTVLGFPANEFKAQEPGTNDEIQQFCKRNYGVSFPVMAKIVVKGEGQHPLYRYLTANQPEAIAVPGSSLRVVLEEKGLLSGEPHDILWNFEKFLVSRDGTVVARFAPDIIPEDPLLSKAIEEQLSQS